MCENQGHEQVLDHALLVGFELDEVLFGSVFQVLREKSFYEFQKTQDSHDLEVTEDLDSLDSLEDGLFTCVREQVKWERRHEIDPEPAFEVLAGNRGPGDY